MKVHVVRDSVDESLLSNILYRRISSQQIACTIQSASLLILV